jgi:hypothetical protein
MNVTCKLLIATVIIVGVHSFCSAQDRGFGVGVILGEPTGISLKGWLTPTTAIDAGLAWSLSRRTSFHLHADYLLHSFHVFQTQERIPIYYGIGGRIAAGRDGEDTRFGLRVVVGAAYLFRDAPVDIFLEVAPIVDLVPGTELRGNAGLGARFYFR